MLGGQCSGGAPGREDNVHLALDQFARQTPEPLDIPLRIAIFEHDRPGLDVPEFPQGPAKSVYGEPLTWDETQDADPGWRPGLLRFSGKRPGECAQRQPTEEGAPVHSTTWSARSRTDSGMVRPKALAVLALITNSNVVGSSTGRSAGLAPLRILSTETAV